MSTQIFDRLWHQTLRRPYKLVKRIDSGAGPLIVLLHGLGRDGQGWQYLVDELAKEPVRAVAFDLLGFGNSPKPAWLDYDADDHAQAVINSIERLHPEQPVIVVGHSMGCLVAVRLAALRPDLVKQLILYEMPLYKGLPNKRYYRLRLNFYNKIYNWIVRYEPAFDANKTKFSDRLARKLNNLEVEPTSWRPYVKSLQHTIYEQTAPDDIPKLSMPMDVIYGSFDMLVIKGTVQYVYGKEPDERMQIHTVRAGHSISKKASKLLAERVLAALQSP
ncbi:MAG TPA: alpha/beta hydrolase [Candidatus Dormibacteraeota bacterium]|nr:alpha/beta hydrolase [Candidatus Dormibacteraeota bacterium]